MIVVWSVAIRNVFRQNVVAPFLWHFSFIWCRRVLLFLSSNVCFFVFVLVENCRKVSENKKMENDWRSIPCKHNAGWLLVSRLKASAVYSLQKTYDVNKTRQLKPGNSAGIWRVMALHSASILEFVLLANIWLIYFPFPCTPCWHWGAMTFSITTHSIMKFSITGLNVTISIKDTQDNDNQHKN